MPSETIAAILAYGFGLLFIVWGMASICAPSRIRDNAQSFTHKVMAFYTRRVLTGHSPEQSLEISHIRFWGITYLVGGVLFIIAAAMRFAI
jgi:hypothetical protein